jgi:hypothetical protein
MSELSNSDLVIKKESGEPNVLMTNIQPSLREGDLHSHRGPTGSRTELAKKRSDQNAIKFGIFFKAALLTGEPRSEYQSSLEGQWETYQPVRRPPSCR